VPDNRLDINVGYKVKGTQQLNAAAKGMNNVKRNAKSTTGSLGKFQKGVNKIDRSLKNMTKDSNRAGVSIGNLGKSMRVMNGAMNVAKIYLLANGMRTVIDASLDMIETNNLFAVSMGDALDSATEFVNKMSEVTGLDVTGLKNSVGTFALLSRSTGMSTDNAEVLSTNLTKLSLDLSSLFNVPVAQAMQDLRSGLVGQSETVYKYGLDVTEASLKQEAMNQGIEKSVRNMSQGEKMGLRYSVMLKQSTLAHGDFARTINEPANQLRILGERFVTLTRSIGNIFIPMLRIVLPYLNGIVIVLIDIANLLSSLVGFEIKDIGGIGNSSDDAKDKVDDLGKSMKNLTSGMDELNVLSTDSGDSTGANVGGFDAPDLEGYDNGLDGIVTKADGIAEDIKKSLGKAFGELKELIDPIVEPFERLAEIGLGNLEAIYNDVLLPFGEWVASSAAPAFFGLLGSTMGALAATLDVLQPILSDVWENILLPLGAWTGGVIVSTMEILTGLFDKFTEAMKDTDSYTATVVKVLAYLTAGVLATAAALGLMALSMAVIQVIMSPVTLVIAAIVAAVVGLVLAIAYLWKNWDEIWGWVVEKATGAWDSIKEMLSGLAEGFSELWTGLSEGLTLMWDAFVNWLTNMKNGVSKWAKGMITGISDMWNTIKLKFELTFKFIQTLYSNFRLALVSGANRLKTKLVTAIIGLKNGFIGAFKLVVNGALSVWNGLVTGFEAGLNFIIRGINFFLNKLNDALSAVNKVAGDLGFEQINLGVSSISEVSISRVPLLARGGILESGQLFGAGENGMAEAIGSHNGSTTVMPLEDTDFVGAMYNAVFDAVTNASGDGQQQPLVVNLDGEVIYKNQEKVSRDRGKSFNMGAFAR